MNREGYRNGHAPRPPPDVLVSAREVAQAGVWLRLEPMGKKALCEGQRLQNKTFQPVDEMIAERDAAVHVIVEKVQGLWSCLFSGAVPVVPELHPRRLDALVQYRAMTDAERVADAETTIRQEQNDGLDVASLIAKTEETLAQTSKLLNDHWPKLAALVIGMPAKDREGLAERAQARHVYVTANVPRAAIEASRGGPEAFKTLVGAEATKLRPDVCVEVALRPDGQGGFETIDSNVADTIPFFGHSYPAPTPPKPATFDPMGIVGHTFPFYGVDNNAFKIGDLILEVMEDEQDGYRSAMKACVVRNPEGLIFFPNPVAKVLVVALIEPANNERRSFEGYALVDMAADHEWLRFGTSNHDDYYPSFTFRYTPPAPACAHVGCGLTEEHSHAITGPSDV